MSPSLQLEEKEEEETTEFRSPLPLSTTGYVGQMNINVAILYRDTGDDNDIYMRLFASFEKSGRRGGRCKLRNVFRESK